MFNMDFSEQIVIDSTVQDWVASPKAGVFRKPLAREDAEQGHATSIVKYEAGAEFSEHGHPRGEEILVLEGVFSENTGDYITHYPTGTYIRNPDGFHHAPFSKEGCTILVKLHQFQDADQQRVCIDTNTELWRPGRGNLKVMSLHSHGSESVALVHWPAGEVFQEHSHFGGEEIYVISGEFIDEYGRYPAGTWIRSPHMSKHHPRVEVDTLIWVKVGHLPVK